MAVQGASQALIAAFTFGIVVNAASAALFLFTRGHGSSIFRDGLRLVLITFLLTSALWAQIDFITTVIDTTSGTMSCQVGLIFSTLFDQLGRFAMEQYLLWAMVTPGKTSAGGMISQIFIAARFIAGGVFVGFTRPQVDTFCVATSSVMPVAITVIALDGLVITSLAARAFMTGLVADAQEGKASSSRSKAILFVMVGFVIWTATSVTMMLGMTTLDLIFRTAVPAIGLAILIIIVTACSGELVSPRGSQSSPPEAPSPRRINISRDISSADSSDYPPSRYEDLKDQAIRSSTTFLQPREAPKAFEDTRGLPNIARPITGIVGMGGVPVQGALFPPTRVETMPLPDRARRPSIAELKQKRGLFDFGKGSTATASAGKLTIGNPILLNNDAQNPLNKIATIDLKEAARAEQDRRAMAMKRESDLVAKRPAPQPPNITPEEALKRSVSVKRKEVASVFSPPTLPSSSLQPVSTSSTTSAQLSPGVEEIRRRSPRQLPADYQDAPVPQRPISPPKPEVSQAPPLPVEPMFEQEQPFVASPVKMRPVSPPIVEKPREQNPPQQIAVRPGIRPSRKLSSPKKEAPPEPSKTPLQRRPTTGLPPGPRARKLNLAKEAGAQAQQTVMFVNNIVYDDPREVQRIIDGANDRASKMAPRPRTPDDSSSVVHRPRPIPRKIEPGTEEARKHRRSRSGGSLVSRKSILMSTAGSPTQLPPLPPPPKSAGMPSRPHPNDTKSMTVDEKMGMFFPSPPRSDNAAKRKSLVPQLPPVPRAFLESNSSPTEGEDHRRSNRTTKTSVQTENLFDVDEIAPKPVNASRFSPETNFADEVGRSWLPGITDSSFRQTQSTQASSQGGAGKRGSSPVLPLRESSWTETTGSRTRDTRDDSTTNWDSIYSPEVAVGVQVAAQIARATSIRRVDSQNIRSRSQPSVAEERASGEVIHFVLDSGIEEDLRANEPWVSGDDNMVRPERASQWHRRVGDNCPSFSDRKEKTRSRKMPPPTPLLLHAGSNMNAMVIHTAEPSPIESPEQALQQIQAQLKKFEQPNRDSVESQGQRLALLENLEMEMGMQENHWHEMQHDLGRNSMSSIGTTNSNRNSRRESVIAPVNATREAPPPPSKANIAQERRALRRSRIRSGSIAKADEPSQLQVPANSRAGAWQQKLAMAEAEMELMDNSDASKLRGFNFLTVSKAQLGSPTPPDSDQSDEEISIPAVRPVQLDAVVAQTKRGQPQRKLLWVPANTTAHRSSSLLWSPPTTKPEEVEHVLPGLSVRPTQRKELAPLSITSSQLWRKPHHKTRATTGLWRPSWATPQPTVQRSSRPVSVQSQIQSQKAPRPVTQRPPRRNKRVTLLPDIIEDPQPLPDKRGTLGIFQFPWGERSDTASVAPVRSTMVMAMPGTMTSGGQTISAALEARSRELESAEYSSSFFDEYDDDDMGISGDEDEDSGDDFDETTLWEIASLLKTDGLPSKDSLFPPPLASSVVDDYMNDIPSDDEGESPAGEDSIVIGLSDEQARESVLWQGGPKTPGRGEHGAGLPHPDEGTWMKYGAAGAGPEVRRVKTRAVEVSVIESDSLWTPETKEADVRPSWTAGGKPTKIPRPSEVKNVRKNRKYHTLGGLWKQPAVKTDSGATQGLFKVDATRSDYRTTSAEPAARIMDRKPRPAEHKPLDRLVSLNMWTKSQNHKARFQQMSHGMWSPPRHSQSSESRGLFTVGRSRADYRTTSQQPAAMAMARKAHRSEHKPLEQLTSTSLWSAKPPQQRERNWITANPQGQHRRPTASKSEWTAALNAAIAASYPSHRNASAQDWSAALDSALSLSYPSSFDPSVRHPVFAASSLSAASEHFHPAATGYTYDVSAVHPAFFGSLAVTCPLGAVHPAMVEYASRQVEEEEERKLESDVLAEQIRQLEEEKMFVARMAGEMYRQRVLPGDSEGDSWTGPEKDARGEEKMEETRAAVKEDAVVRRQRSRSSKEKEERRAQIMAQIKAIEEAGELDTFGPGGKGVEEGGNRKSGVVLRY
ncbi:hypothetical protein BR93DRAFT_970966 [Coniochaeta sp. PMI_546]|nr:hypothetical protein BR93DRAFT_970966 [Coniochaeta sp. PMI_546]